ncbi:MAG: hypothetical protein ACP5MC_00685 [Candidatus Micrarchaeia archaeon]
MNLIEATLVLAVAIIVIATLVYFLFAHVLVSKVTENQAVALVEADIQKNYPGAEIQLTNVSPSVYRGSWHVVVSVITNATTPCPNYFVYAYDYPKFGFVPTNVNNYTSSCIIYGFTTSKPFIIASFPVAIARATSLNISSVINYIKQFGYSNVSVTASFMNTTKLENRNYTGVWLVNYTAKKANYSVIAAITQLNGSLIEAYEQARNQSK